jgi:hypothetical protein
VADVYVQVAVFDEPEWPFSETVWVLTTADADDVKSWFEEYMAPDECREGWDGTERERVEVPPAFHRCGVGGIDGFTPSPPGA